jgi:hypothetical protein
MLHGTTKNGEGTGRMTGFGTWGRRVWTGAGCAAALVLVGGASAQAPTPASPPDFTGYFSQNSSEYLPPAKGGPGPVMDHPDYPHQELSPKTGLLVREWVGDYANPILKPPSATEVRKNGETEIKGGFYLAAYQTCWPAGVPLVLTMRENIQLLQQPDMVTIIYQRDHLVRHVYLNRPHAKEAKASWYGESVGHYEGDTLVVDTIGQNGKTRADRYGSFTTPAIHVTERYHLADNGQALQVDFTVEDPGAFNMPWSGMQKFRRVRGPFEEVICAENNRNVETGQEYDMPVAAKADF